MNKAMQLTVAGVLLLALTGCSTYRLVNVSLKTDVKTSPEITAVPDASIRMAHCHNVVINYAKDFIQACRKNGINQAGDEGIWQSELERIFLQKGFNVIAASPQTDAGSSDKKDNTLWLLETDLIIQINAYAYSAKTPLGSKTKKIIHIYDSDSYGDKDEPLPSYQVNREHIMKDVNNYLQHDLGNDARMAFLDCKVIDAKTGEVILFYRNRLYQLKPPRQPDMTLSYLFKKDHKSWVLVKQTGLEEPKQAAKQTDNGIKKSSSSKLALIRQICSDVAIIICNHRSAGKRLLKLTSPPTKAGN